MSGTVRFVLDGREIEVDAALPLLEIARQQGIELPHLCQQDGLRADGNCRSCVVEIDGERTLAPSCCRTPRDGMVVRTQSDRARESRRTVVELLLAEAPASSGDLASWAEALGAARARFAPEPVGKADRSHPAIVFDPAACIHCLRCQRACGEVQGHDVIGNGERGHIVFDAGATLAASSCVACGQCVAACPTGALFAATPAGSEDTSTVRHVDSVCPYCGVGCQLRYSVDASGIVAVAARDGPANAGRLCVKGRFGYDYVRHPERLTRPLIRLAGSDKDPKLAGNTADWRRQFREADWDEALDFAAAGLLRQKAEHGPQALAGFGSAKGSNEEAYLFQKLVRLGFGTNNVDHCTRLCHASSVAALLEGIGSGAVSNPVRDAQFADVIFVIGANPTVNHPVAASFLRNAALGGARLIVADPRETELARHATHVLQFAADGDVLLLNALLHVIVFEDRINADFVARRVSGYDEVFRDNLRAYAPEAIGPRIGIPAETLREVARLYSSARAAMIFWGMGVSQHTHGTDNVRCLIALALLTGQIGRRGTGLHPLRGQNNVQGASDAGLIPMMLPDYNRVADPAKRMHFESLWGAPIDPRPGLTVTEIIDSADRGAIRGMLIMGENPAMSDPDLDHARAALARLDHLVVQDIFLTETAALADVILPASSFAEKSGTTTNTDRCVQMGRPALPPPGLARQDLEILIALARRMGLDWTYASAAEVFAEMRQAMPSIAGISWDRLEREGAVTYPCASETAEGDEVIFTADFPTPDGRGRIFPVAFRPAAEMPDEDFPWALMTGRQLEHWHTGSMTRRARTLDALEPEAYVNLNPLDLASLGLAEGDPVRLETRRGAVTAAARIDAGLAQRTVFMPFCYVEAAANILTNPAIDPVGKIPEFKYCAVRVSAG